MVIQQGLVFTDPPFPSCHASSITELKDGSILATWFGGKYEGHKEVAIWTSVKSRKSPWTKPVKVADGITSDTIQYPCWNPVLVRTRANDLFLYYKVGPSPREWWGMMKTSSDEGKSWSVPTRLPDGFLGPIKNKSVQMPDGSILHPSSTESHDEKKWIIHLETTDARSQNWTKTEIDCDTFGVIQPSLLTYPDGRLQMLCRSRQNAIVQTWSNDNGKSWSALTKTNVVNPNSGIDAVTLKDGLQFLVYNPGLKGKEWYNGRNRLMVAISKDGAKWEDVYELENQPSGEYSYPAVIQSKDGLVHIMYTYDRKNMKYVVIKLFPQK